MSQFLIAVDQLINTVLNGWADETLSARAYRNSAKQKSKWQRVERVINAIFFWEPDHCKASYRMELERRHLPVGYRNTEADE